MGDGRLVALEGSVLGNLATPPGGPQQLPHVAGMVFDSELASDYLRNALQRPYFVGKTVSHRSSQQNFPQALLLLAR
jgi:hypothetical protein